MLAYERSNELRERATERRGRVKGLRVYKRRGVGEQAQGIEQTSAGHRARKRSIVCVQAQ